MSLGVGTRPTFDDTVVLQLAQPCDQDGSRDERHAAMDVVRRSVAPATQFAHDERSPAGGENLRCLPRLAELTIAF